MGIKSRTFDIPSSTAGAANGLVPGDKSYRLKLTEKEKKRVETLIRNAKSLQEITRLEKVRASWGRLFFFLDLLIGSHGFCLGDEWKSWASERLQYSLLRSCNK